MTTSWLRRKLVFENQIFGVGIVFRKAQVCAKIHCPTSAGILFSEGVEGGIHPSSVLESQNSPADSGETVSSKLSMMH